MRSRLVMIKNCCYIGHSWSLSLLFSSFQHLSVNAYVHFKMLAMNGFEPLTCGIKVTAPPTEAQPLPKIRNYPRGTLFIV